MKQLLDSKTKGEIENGLALLNNRHVDLIYKINKLRPKIKNEKAEEYLFHGILRRLGTIKRCIENIYFIFPLDRKTLLEINEQQDIIINLHAFFMNIFGLLDNMAWVVVYEKNKAGKIKRTKIGLYRNEIQKLLSSEFKNYINSEEISHWHNSYLKEYRDTLAHRIPLYVPPKFLEPEEQEEEKTLWRKWEDAGKRRNIDEEKKIENKIKEIGVPAPVYTHSLDEDKKLMKLHIQVITDFTTIEKIIDKFCEMFSP
ncbi:MAG: hypothetical protein ACQ9MH_12975 [Nitrospinales bacterium]